MESQLETLPEQARRLSSGTMAGLTGLNRYDQIEPVQAEFVEFCEETAGQFQTWQQAWKAYTEVKQRNFDFLVIGSCLKKGTSIFRGSFSLSVTAKTKREAEREAVKDLIKSGYSEISAESVNASRMVPDEKN